MLQSALAFSPDRTVWYLVNATPDVTHQLARWPELWPRGSSLRHGPVRGIVLTDGELDHVAGLLHLREGADWTLYATPPVVTILEEELRLLPALRRYGPVRVQPVSPQSVLVLGRPPKQVEVCLTPVGRHSPRYVGPSQPGSAEGAVVAVTLRNPSTGRRVVYAPAVDHLSDTLARCCEGADLVLFDGTFWTDDELAGLGVAPATATEMGHVPVSGSSGSAAWLAALPAETKLYVHVNNTNPLVDPHSQERAALRRLGLDVAAEGWTIDL